MKGNSFRNSININNTLFILNKKHFIYLFQVYGLFHVLTHQQATHFHDWMKIVG